MSGIMFFLYTLHSLKIPGWAHISEITVIYKNKIKMDPETMSHHNSLNVRARELKFWENDQPTPCVTCHVSCVTCHVSNVTYHLPHVNRHLSPVTFHFFWGKKMKNGGASWWRVCYQRGLPRLVYQQTEYFL